MVREKGSKKKKPKDFGHELPNPLRTSGFIDRLDGISYRYDYTYRLVKYLQEHSDVDPDVLRRITECYNWARGGVFEDLALGTKIFKSNACKQHRLCANCASIRAKKSAMDLAEAIYALSLYFPNIRPVFVTITIKNGPDIAERFRHIMNGFKRLQKKRTNAREGKGSCLRQYSLGGLFSCEIKHTDKGLWHPHLHGVELLPTWVNLREYDTELETDWLGITKDSFVTRVKAIRMTTPEELIKSCMEICKYSMKQASMTPALQYEAYKATSNKKLVRRFGVLRGFTMSEKYERFEPKADLSKSPFQEFLLQRVSTTAGTRFRATMGETWSGLTKEVLRCMHDTITDEEKTKHGLRPSSQGDTDPNQLPEALELVQKIRDKHRSSD